MPWPVDELHSGLVTLGPHASGKTTGRSDATIAVRVQQPTVANLRDLQVRYGTPVIPERVGHMEVLDMPQSRRATCDLGSRMVLGSQVWNSACVLIHAAPALGIQPQYMPAEV